VESPTFGLIFLIRNWIGFGTDPFMTKGKERVREEKEKERREGKERQGFVCSALGQ